MRQRPYKFFVKVINFSGHSMGKALLVGFPAPIDIFLEALIEVLVPAALLNTALVLQLDFGHQQS